ncbi:GNAT family N-acetyltransferase [Streptoverticillium reticulum]|uniref:GNAT family N-acetyltransferase n=1 Tax=Streptoverticillium reticulum TaxID=1433415 RepID=UPI0039BF5B57
MAAPTRHTMPVPAGAPWESWFPSGRPGLGSLTEHIRSTGTGHWWADDPRAPRAGAVGCAGHVLLGGDPRALRPEDLAPLAHSWFAAPDRFLPLLGAAFDRIVPWERMVWVRDGGAGRAPVPSPDIRIRRLTAADAKAVRALGPDLAWIAESWGGPHALAVSGHCRGAFRNGRLLSLACTYFLGSRYEDIAVATAPEARGRGLARACVHALCADVASRGRTASWTCSRDNHPSRALAAATGFRLVREYVHYAAGRAVAPATCGTVRSTAP